MRIRVVALLGLLPTVLLSAVAQGQSVGAGPRPVYLHPQSVSWSFSLNKPPKQVMATARSVGQELGLEVTELEEGGLKLRLLGLTGAQLDRYRTYPIYNYKNWKPMGPFAVNETKAVRSRGLEEPRRGVTTKGVVSLQLVPPADSEGAYSLKSLCGAHMRRWRGGQSIVESTPTGALSEGPDEGPLCR